MNLSLCALVTALLIGSGGRNVSVESAPTQPQFVGSADPDVQSLVAAGIAQKVGARLVLAGDIITYEKRRNDRNLTLKVLSSQTVTYARENDSANTADESEASIRTPRAAMMVCPTTCVTVDVESVMTPTTMTTTFQGSVSEQADLIVELFQNDGQPMFCEKHWYQDHGGYVSLEPYSITDPHGVGGLKVEHSLFRKIQQCEPKGVPVCALAEFFYTWVDKRSEQVFNFRDVMLAEATVVTREVNPRAGDAEMYHLVRTRYDVKNTSLHSICIDHFWVSMDFMLVAWNTEYTYAEFGSHVSYMTVDRTYKYEYPEAIKKEVAAQ